MSTRPLSRLSALAALAVLCMGHGGGGCGGAEEAEAHHGHAHGGASTGAACPPSGAPTAQDFGQAFLQDYCLSCHGASVSGPARGGAPVDVNFDTLEDVRRWRESIDAHAAAGPRATNTDMPPAGLPRPTDEERRRLGQWLACGAP
jgi:uncharacterized membrane protein